MKKENKIVSYELAKRLKDLGFNVPVSSCYTKELHYTNDSYTEFVFDWVLRDHIVTEYETRDRNYGVGDEEEKWIKIYFENYHNPENDDDCVNWNINTYELHLEYYLDGKRLKTTNPELWEKRLRPYCTEEWYRTVPRDKFIEKEKYLYETILESQDEDWIYFFGLSLKDLIHTEYNYEEVGVEFSFPMKEYMSAPDIFDVVTWLKNEYNIDINITTKNGLTYDGEGIWDKNIEFPKVIGEDSWIGCFEKMVDLIIDFIIITKE